MMMMMEEAEEDAAERMTLLESQVDEMYGKLQPWYPYRPSTCCILRVFRGAPVFPVQGKRLMMENGHVVRVLSCVEGQCTVRFEKTGVTEDFSTIAAAPSPSWPLWLNDTESSLGPLYIANEEVPADVRAAESDNVFYRAALEYFLSVPRGGDPLPDQMRGAAMIMINCHGDIPSSTHIVKFPDDVRAVTQLMLGSVGAAGYTNGKITIRMDELVPHMTTEPLRDFDAFVAALDKNVAAVRGRFKALSEASHHRKKGRDKWFQRSMSLNFVVRCYTMDVVDSFQYPNIAGSSVVCATGLLNARGETVIPVGVDLTEFPPFIAFMRKKHPQTPMRVSIFKADKVSEFTNKDLYEWLYSVGCRAFAVTDNSCAVFDDRDTSAKAWARAQTLRKHLEYDAVAAAPALSTASADAVVGEEDTSFVAQPTEFDVGPKPSVTTRRIWMETGDPAGENPHRDPSARMDTDDPAGENLHRDPSARTEEKPRSRQTRRHQTRRRRGWGWGLGWSKKIRGGRKTKRER